MSVAIIDSGCANIASVAFALDRLGAAHEVTRDEAVISSARHVIFPGVGAAPFAMNRLRQRGLDKLVMRLKQPCLGICLGMQLLFEATEEGDTTCLGLIPGRVRRIEGGPGLSVPHMGWNTLKFRTADAPLLAGLDTGVRAYFVHSFAGPVTEDTLATTDHGAVMAAVVARDNFFGVQFHPERSGAVGARVLANFLRL